MAETLAPKTPKPRRWWRILKRLLIAALLLLVIFVYGVLPYGFARLVTSAGTRPADRALTDTPATYGAPFQDVEFDTLDGIKISAWLLPSRDKKATIIFSHGLFRSRRELLERALDLWKAGYGALLYDSRNHGTSGAARVSLGYYERFDAEAAVRFLRDDIKTTDRLVLYGISMGAVTALMAAAETPEVAAVISDSAFLSFDDTIAHHIRVFLHLPAFPLANELRYFIERRANFDGNKLNALEAVKQIHAPVLFISGQRDKRMPPDITESLFNASDSPLKDLLIVDGAETAIHGHAFQADPKGYIDRVTRFLDAALAGREHSEKK
ncbi:MAG: alpha/beta fold hydrolase [Acidobacteria bacterium]|nr:alpha/beta fold hydrolase [Acidobacteriota bacterium]